MPSAALTLPRLRLTGVCPPARGAVLAGLVRGHEASVWLVVAEDLRSAEHLAEDQAIAFNCGDHRELVQMRYRDFAAIVQPRVGDIVIH